MPTTAIVADRTDARTSRSVGHYLLDGERTRIDVHMRVLGVPVRMTADEVSGAIKIPSDLLSINVAVAADVTRLSRAGAGRLLPPVSSDSHGVARFQADGMTPILESFVDHDGDRPLWALDGELTLNGVTRPLRIAIGVVRTIEDGEAIAFTGTASLRCADYGIARRGGLLSNTVHINVSGVAQRC